MLRIQPWWKQWHAAVQGLPITWIGLYLQYVFLFCGYVIINLPLVHDLWGCWQGTLGTRSVFWNCTFVTFNSNSFQNSLQSLHWFCIGKHLQHLSRLRVVWRNLYFWPVRLWSYFCSKILIVVETLSLMGFFRWGQIFEGLTYMLSLFMDPGM